MTALKNIRDIEDLDIISLGDIPKTPKSQWHYDKWFKIGAGLRTSKSTSNHSTNDASGSAKDIALDNIRLYTLTKVHKNIMFE